MRVERPFVYGISLPRDGIEEPNAYPFTIPAVRQLDGLELHPVTYFVGENGSGKSTILEALAVACGFNAEGGTVNFRFATRRSESTLHRHLRLLRSPRRPRPGFFLRAEIFFNVATEIERLDAEVVAERIPVSSPPIIDSYGGGSLHERSHGESFMALLQHRFGRAGLYILDEPEAALSPARQVELLRRMRQLVLQGSQFLVATHSPIVLAYPEAQIYQLDAHGLSGVEYDETEHVRFTRDFLNDREKYLREIFDDA